MYKQCLPAMVSCVCARAVHTDCVILLFVIVDARCCFVLFALSACAVIDDDVYWNEYEKLYNQNEYSPKCLRAGAALCNSTSLSPGCTSNKFHFHSLCRQNKVGQWIPWYDCTLLYIVKYRICFFCYSIIVRFKRAYSSAVVVVWKTRCHRKKMLCRGDNSKQRHSTNE